MLNKLAGLWLVLGLLTSPAHAQQPTRYTPTAAKPVQLAQVMGLSAPVINFWWNAQKFSATAGGGSRTLFTPSNTTSNSQGIISFWFYDTASGANFPILYGQTGTDPNCLQVYHLSTNHIRLHQGVTGGCGGANSITADTGAILAANRWNHYIIAWDTNFGAGSKLITASINGAPDTLTITDTGIAFAASYNANIAYGGGASPATGALTGCLAQFYLIRGIYKDESLSANVSLFREPSNGAPVYLGPRGERPFNTLPDMFMGGPAQGTGNLTNLGTMGGGTGVPGVVPVVLGSVDVCQVSPPAS